MESLYKNGTFSCTQWNKDVTWIWLWFYKKIWFDCFSS
jgi:hypothetical protein